MRAIGIPSYAGGFDLGVAQNFEIIGKMEDGNFGVETVKYNMGKMFDTLDGKKIGLGTFPVLTNIAEHHEFLRDHRGVELIYGCPPCTSFSSAAHSSGKKWETSDVIHCTQELFDAMELAKPRAWVYESVTQAYTLGHDMISSFEKQAWHMGYHVTHFFADNALFGVPQSRRRYMMVCHKDKIDWEVPNGDVVTVRQALEGVEKDEFVPVQDQWIEVVRRTPQWSNLRDIWEAMYPERIIEAKEKGLNKVKGRPMFLIHRIAWNRPCSVITSVQAHVHPEEDRYLSPVELQVLSGYPKNYAILGNNHDRRAQIAKAVLPQPAEYVSRMLRQGMERGESAKGGTTEIVDFRKIKLKFVA